MTTYTWAGGSGSFATPSDWFVNGAPASTAPGSTDDVEISTPGNYTISINVAAVNSLTITDPSATIDVITDLVAGTVDNAGSIISVTPKPSSYLEFGNLFNQSTGFVAGGLTYIGNSPV